MSRPPLSTELVWELLSDKLRGFLLRRVNDPQLAEDLLQETFLRIHRKIGGLDDTRRLSGWVFQIARNLLTDHYRSGEPSAISEEGPEEADAGEAQNLNALVAGWLPEMVDGLPEPYREPVALYELEGLPQQAIADRLGLSLSGAKSRIQRGRAMLKSTLLDCCSFERDRRGNIIGYQRNAADGCGVCDPDCESA